MAFSSGKELERTIEGLFSFAETTVNKTDPPVRVINSGKGGMFKGIFTAKGPLDFEGGYRGFFIGYEAKTCAGRRFSMRRIEGHQMGRMAALDKDLSPTGAIIQFEAVGDRDRDFLCLVPYRTLLAMQNDGARSLNAETALQLTSDDLVNRIYQLDPFNYELFEAVLAAELKLCLDRREAKQSEPPAPEPAR